MEKKQKLSLLELINLEKATYSICRKYENSIKNYDGSINQNGNDYYKYQKFNDIHNKIIIEMENLVLEHYDF